MNKTARSVALAACCLLLLGQTAAAAAPQRVVAIGDVHGAYDQFVSILQRMGLVDARRKWIGGATALVQVGDLTNRGGKSLDCLELMMSLQEQARKQNGRVVALLGNHEVMDLLGHLRSVSAEDYSAFVTHKSDQVRQQAYQDYLRFLRTRNQRRGLPPPNEAAEREEWMKKYPPGSFEFRDAHGPLGRYGRWLRQHDAVAQIGDVLFCHAGLNPRLRFNRLEELNDRAHSEMAEFDSVWQWLSERNIIWRYLGLNTATGEAQAELKFRQSSRQPSDPALEQAVHKLLAIREGILMGPEGPLWFRGYGHQRARQERLNAELGPLLDRLKARYIVLGHTPVENRRIQLVFDQRAFRIDTAMQAGERGGQPSALEIQDGRFTAYYLKGEPEVLRGPPGGTRAGAKLR